MIPVIRCEAVYLTQTQAPLACCKNGILEIIVDKTKEIIVSAKQDFITGHAVLCGQLVETVFIIFWHTAVYASLKIFLRNLSVVIFDIMIWSPDLQAQQ